MIKLRHPSLEFSFLPNSHRKGLKVPRVVLLDRESEGGFYCRQTKDRNVIDLLGMDTKEGPIVALCASQNAGTLAHEYRHHMQTEQGHRLNSVWEPSGKGYKADILHYFRTYWFELDALMYELKYAPTDVSRLWREWLYE